VKYYAAFSFYFPSSLPDSFVIPLQLDLGGIHFEVTAIDDERKSAKGFVEAPVSPARLTLSSESKGLNGTRVPAGVIVPEAADLLHKAKEVISLLSFIADGPVLEARRAFEDRIVPETSRDINCLRVLGTNEIHHRLEAHPSARTFVHGDLRDDYVERLAGKGTGLELYSQALLQRTSAGQFREFWRMIEAAFGSQDEELIRLLSKYGPARELEFTEQELRKLLVIRGRVSHAKSLAGIRELREASREALRKLPRLKCLAEQVILTKKVWGVISLETDRLARLAAYVQEDGSLVFFTKD
jgi:hypothetical protein